MMMLFNLEAYDTLLMLQVRLLLDIVGSLE